VSEAGSEWWRTAVLYQIYVRSFADTDGDGLGDLPGIRSRLPYVSDLGVDGIWLTPFYPTPDADHGYDVSDYENVDPRFGTLADFDALVADAHDLGLRVIVDIVPNHTSSEHPWFRNALADPNGPDRARYVFRPGRDGGPPNNWESAFGGPAWTEDERSGEYYLHLFAPEQPDLDWHNETVRRPSSRSCASGSIAASTASGSTSHNRSTRSETWPTCTSRTRARVSATGTQGSSSRSSMTCIASGGRSSRSTPATGCSSGDVPRRPDEARRVRPAGRATADVQLPVPLRGMGRGVAARVHRRDPRGVRCRRGAGDMGAREPRRPRVATRYGGGAEGVRRARAAALLMLALPGAAYVYAGQELGLEEVDLADELRQDPIFARTGGRRAGRDGCRVPIPWTTGPESASRRVRHGSDAAVVGALERRRAGR
jgi:alpha-glucosidase